MSKKASKAPLPASFEDAIAELEKLISHIESNELPLDETVTSYQRGSQLVNYCSTQLQKVEEQIKTLDEDALKPRLSAQE